jgi:hypothetical protein
LSRAVKVIIVHCSKHKTDRKKGRWKTSVFFILVLLHNTVSPKVQAHYVESEKLVLHEANKTVPEGFMCVLNR